MSPTEIFKLLLGLCPSPKQQLEEVRVLNCSLTIPVENTSGKKGQKTRIAPPRMRALIALDDSQEIFGRGDALWFVTNHSDEDAAGGTSPL